MSRKEFLSLRKHEIVDKAMDVVLNIIWRRREDEEGIILNLEGLLKPSRKSFIVVGILNSREQ